MMAVLIYILCVVAALAGIVLIAPIHFKLAGELAESLSFQGRVGWAGGVFNLNVSHRQGKNQITWGILGYEKKNSARQVKATRLPQDDKQDQGARKDRKKSTVSITSFLNLEFFMAVKKAFHKLMRDLHLKLNLSGIYGFDDPSLTGIVQGLIYTLNTRSSSININPDFTKEVVDLKGSVQGWFIPLQIILTAISILLMKPVRAIWWPRIKFRKKQKEDVQYA